MANHPNRKARVAESPPPELIADTRSGVLQTQAEAAAEVYATARTWQDWEAGRRRMPRAAWELFLLAHCAAGHLRAQDWREWIRPALLAG
ncbi:MAG: XRE family transcriptional regulator [Aquabacterium sp.]|nr:XRE family transcriptional regulator [Aquabacterium sp.]